MFATGMYTLSGFLCTMSFSCSWLPCLLSRGELVCNTGYNRGLSVLTSLLVSISVGGFGVNSMMSMVVGFSGEQQV